MSSGQLPHQDSQASPSHQPGSQNYERYTTTPEYNLDAEETATPRVIAQPQQHLGSSGSDTEREVSQKEKQKKAKAKEKAKDRRTAAGSASSSAVTADMIAAEAGLSSASSRQRSSGKSKKNDDWSEVTNPEERRRIQNRIAQRKFREKAREQKERSERELRNQEHAASSYQVPGPEDLDIDDQLSGVPWGGPSLRFMVAKGHESLSNSSSSHHSGGSQRGSYYVDDAATVYAHASGSHGSSAGLAVTAGMTSADAMAGFLASAPAEPYYYMAEDGSQAYAYGSSRSSSSDFAQGTDPQDQEYYDHSSFY
ncbi:hypothetical protein SEPCBS119000_002321 [Sporothrix epigloea]|uniref:BZIP domain-containing protein n=1 Tax=Sporothrix epigloea TaxID=1892477 RepID=A0ABP0DFR6_9PEZI